MTYTDGAKEVPKNRIPLNPLYPRISSYPVSLNRLPLHIRLLLFVFVSILSPSDLRKVIVPLLSFVHFHVGELLKKIIENYLILFQLLYLRIVSMLFSTSDFRHAVCTPAMVLLSQVLGQVGVTG